MRKSLPPDSHRRLSRLICRRLDGLLGALGARQVAVYAPFQGEADLSWLWNNRYPAQARSFYFPRVSGNEMVFREARDPARDLHPDVFGIPAPSADAPAAISGSLEVVIAPGLAFDLSGTRIGSGAGYYDRWLGSNRLCPVVVGAGFDFQVVWDVRLPAESFDERMDWVVTNREVVRCLPFTYR